MTPEKLLQRIFFPARLIEQMGLYNLYETDFRNLNQLRSILGYKNFLTNSLNAGNSCFLTFYLELLFEIDERHWFVQCSRNRHDLFWFASYFSLSYFTQKCFTLILSFVQKLMKIWRTHAVDNSSIGLELIAFIKQRHQLCDRNLQKQEKCVEGDEE